MTVLAIKAAVRARDGHRCTECGLTNEEHVAATGKQLDVHRLAPGSPYTLEGCVAICRGCHGPKPRSPSRPVGYLPCGRVRLVVTVAREVHIALKVEAAAAGVNMSDLASAILSEALKGVVEQVRKRRVGAARR